MLDDIPFVSFGFCILYGFFFHNVWNFFFGKVFVWIWKRRRVRIQKWKSSIKMENQFSINAKNKGNRIDPYGRYRHLRTYASIIPNKKNTYAELIILHLLTTTFLYQHLNGNVARHWNMKITIFPISVVNNIEILFYFGFRWFPCYPFENWSFHLQNTWLNEQRFGNFFYHISVSVCDLRKTEDNKFLCIYYLIFSSTLIDRTVLFNFYCHPPS